LGILPVVRFSTTILQFGERGEKSGWTYIRIPIAMAEKLHPGFRKTFRVKGSLDQFPISGAALLPMGDGGFILPVNGRMRKGLRKAKGARIRVQLERDRKPVAISPELLDCLDDEPAARAHFRSLPPSQQAYFSRWIEAARTEPTRAKRIAQAVTALLHKSDFGLMLRSLRPN
jgi:hypothetical protein